MSIENRRGVTLEEPHISAVRVLMANLREAAARYPRPANGFDDLSDRAGRMASMMRRDVEGVVELDAEEAMVLARLIERSIRWIPEFDEIQTLTGYTIDEVMQFYLDVKRALGVFRVDDSEMAQGRWTSRVHQYPELPRFMKAPDDVS